MSTIDLLYNDHGQSNDAKNNATSIEIPYLVTGVESVQEAINALAESDDVPKTHGSLSVSGYDFDELPASGAYKIVVKYGQSAAASSSASWSSDDDADSNPEITIDIGANSDTRKHCIVRKKVSNDDDDIKAKTAINVDMDGNINGCTVLTGYQTRNEVYYMDVGRLTASYEKALGKLVGSINAKAFRGYAIGEVRFDGATYTYREGQKDKVKVTFKYSISPNLVKVPFDKWLMDKRGWDYAWIKYTVDEKDNEPKAEYAVIDQVSEYHDFGRLGIGK
jgi:hypothetical protein